jgi:hypothetical protein
VLGSRKVAWSSLASALMILDVRVQAPACSSVVWRFSLILAKIRPEHYVGEQAYFRPWARRTPGRATRRECAVERKFIKSLATGLLHLIQSFLA